MEPSNDDVSEREPTLDAFLSVSSFELHLGDDSKPSSDRGGVADIEDVDDAESQCVLV